LTKCVTGLGTGAGAVFDCQSPRACGIPVSVPTREIKAEIEELRKKMEENQRQLAALVKKIARLEGQSDTELLRRVEKSESGPNRALLT
jgi:hypothetical protein